MPGAIEHNAGSCRNCCLGCLYPAKKLKDYERGEGEESAKAAMLVHTHGLLKIRQTDLRYIPYWA